MHTTHRLAALALALLAACSPAAPAAIDPTPSPSADPASPNPSSAPPMPASIAYATAVHDAPGTDLWLYDPATDSLRRLTEDRERVVEIAPRFRTRTALTYIARRSGARPRVMELDLDTGISRTVARIDADEVFGLDWSADGTTAALGAIEWSRPRGMSVRLLGSDGTLRTLARYRTGCGREGMFSDEFDVRFSTDETELLVTNVCTDPPSVRVIDLEGHDVLEPMEGTQARWIDGDTAILVRLLGLDGEPDRWVLVSTADGTQTPVGLPDGVGPAEVSPDGERIAYQDLDDQSIWVLDRATGSRRRLLRHHVAPFWLSTETIVASRVVACPPAREDGRGWCHGEVVASWIPNGRTTAINVVTRNRGRVALGTTLPVLFRGIPNLDAQPA